MSKDDDLLPNSASRKRMLLKAARSYRDALTDDARTYLHGRGFTDEVISHFGLGYVAEPLAEHRPAQGMLSIPYITPKNGIKSIRFRCIAPHVCKDVEHHPKYWGESGIRSGMFNTRDLASPSDTIAVCEGELDAVTLSGSGILPAVGIPGASGWQPHFPRLFSGFSKVILVADGDDAGRKLASTFRRAMPSSGRVILCGIGEDVNSTFLAKGKEGLAALLKGDDDDE